MKIDIEKLVGGGYEEVFKNMFTDEFLAHYVICPGSKDSKKSVVLNGFTPIKKILTNIYGNCVLAKNELNSHKKSTLMDFKFALKKFSKQTDYDWFSLFNIVSAPSPKITFIPTGQVILFVGFDGDNANRFSGIKAEVGLFTYLGLDEVIERGKGGQGEELQKKWITAFDQLHDSVFRGPYEEFGIDFDSDCHTAISFNPWSGENWVNTLFMSELEESEEILETTGKQVFYDPNFRLLAKGKMVMFVNCLVNEFMNYGKKISKFMTKYSDYETYKTSTLGMRGEFKGGIYSHLLKYVNYLDYNAADIKVNCYTGGIDYGAVKDASVAYLIGFGENKSDVFILDGIYHDNSTSKVKLSPKEQALMLLDFYEEIAERFHFIKRGSLPVFVDAHAIELIEHLNDFSKVRGMDWIYFTQSSKTKKGQRIYTLKSLLSAKKINIVDNPIGNANSMLIKELKIAKWDKSGDRFDKFDHGINAFEYSWLHMMKELNRLMDYY